MNVEQLRYFTGIFVLASAVAAQAQGTAFSYQGRLNDGTSPATGVYDFQFTLYDAASGGSVVAGPLNDPATGVTNGLFNVMLDFGANFPGASRWVEINVRTNGGGGYSTLSPRQEITPAPYAITAENLNGTLGSGSLSGTYSSTLVLNNAANQVNGAFTGNGGGLSGVNALTLGGFGAGQFWQLTGNGGTTAGLNFLGTTDFQPLELQVNTTRAFRLEPTPTDPSHALIVNVLGGSPQNFLATGVYGATIAGGGARNYMGVAGANSVTADFGTVGGGLTNTSSGLLATVAGGGNNLSSATAATVAGGVGNTSSAIGATVAGGANNTSSAQSATVGGGSSNNSSANAATVAGGNLNSSGGNYATVGGGNGNTSSGYGATVAGGSGNVANLNYATVGGGQLNTSSGLGATVGGGDGNLANENYATIGGGYLNTSSGVAATVGGGWANLVSPNQGTVGGGYGNQILDMADSSTIAGGNQNTVSIGAGTATIGGGSNNTAGAFLSVISGGKANVTAGPAPYGAVGGGKYNQANGTASTIAGGILNRAEGWADTVGGGQQNIAQGINAGGDPIDGPIGYVIGGADTIGGGYANQTSNFGSTVSGGSENRAFGYDSTVSGGEGNLATNSWSTVGGGRFNLAGGQFSFAAGLYAQALHDRSFIWSSYPAAAPTFASDTFFVSATNGIGINCGNQRGDGGGAYWLNLGRPNSGSYLIDTSVGAYLTLGGIWQNASDRNRKTDFAPVNPRTVLDKLAALSVQFWRYTNETATVRHLGPTAQDFKATFGLGVDDKSIGTVDESGVALAAIQGLNEKLEETRVELKRSEAENAELKQRLDRLEQALDTKSNGGVR